MTNQSKQLEAGQQLFDGLSPVTVKAIINNDYTGQEQVIAMNHDKRHLQAYSGITLTDEPEFYIAVSDYGQVTSEAALMVRATEDEVLEQAAAIFKVTIVDGSFKFEEVRNRKLKVQATIEDVMAANPDPEATSSTDTHTTEA